MTAPPFRKISDNLLRPDDDKNPTRRRQNLGKILFDQSNKNKHQKIRISLDQIAGDETFLVVKSWFLKV
jgi:hypothetical protein